MSLIFFDFETGGVKDHHPNIQLAAVVVDGDWNELAVFEEKIRFDESLAEPEALKINRYAAEAWKDAKPSADVARLFSEFLRPYCSVEKISKRGSPYYVAKLAGHNAASFDGPRLRRMFEEAGVFCPTELHVRDTLQLALWWHEKRGLTPKSYRLTELCAALGIPTDGAHEALTDVRLSVALAKRLMET